MKQNKKLKKIGIGCLATLMAILFSMPVLAADNSPELLVTKGQNANQVTEQPSPEQFRQAVPSAQRTAV